MAGFPQQGKSQRAATFVGKVAGPTLLVSKPLKLPAGQGEHAEGEVDPALGLVVPKGHAVH